MSYIGAQPTTAAFPFDQFSGNGTTTAFTMSYAPASTTSMVVCISGVVQNPNTYNISGLTLTFTQAPPTGTNNIAILYLGLPVQVGVPTPGSTVQFALGSAANPSITFIGDTNTGIYSPGADTLAFVEGGTEVVRIDSSGNVGVGTTAPDNIFHVAKASTSTSVGSSTSIVKIQNTQSSALGETSGIEFFNRSTSGSAKLAGVYGVYENYNATGYAGALAFATESSGAANVTERMRIDSSGSVGIGLTPNSTYRLHVKGAGATSGTVSFLAENSSGTSQLFLRNDNFFNSGAIANYSVAGTGLVIDVNNFVGKTTSSLRYKKDIVDYDKGLTALNLLRPVYYKSAVEGPNGIDSKQHAGFVAEEIADAGFEEFLVRDLEGSPDAIQYAHITALLVASIKELKAELDVCKAEIAALKGV